MLSILLFDDSSFLVVFDSFFHVLLGIFSVAADIIDFQVVFVSSFSKSPADTLDSSNKGLGSVHNY